LNYKQVGNEFKNRARDWGGVEMGLVIRVLPLVLYTISPSMEIVHVFQKKEKKEMGLIILYGNKYSRKI